MALKGKFDKAAFEAYAQRSIEQHRQNVIEALTWMGGECVRDAKSNGSYTDRTGNLRNSVGFVIFENGNIVHEYFEKTASGTEKSDQDGISTGKQLAVNVGSDFPGIVLVVVAGMKYAMYVESRGYNVLTSAELMARQELPKLFEALKP